jgi:uncharacterized protein YdaU (DUF1376 family)
LFPADYFGDTKHLTCEQHGAYLQLLLLAWEMPDCAIPDDDRVIARMISISMKRWRAIKPTVMAFWTLENNRWTQRRLSRERLYIENQIELRRAAGKLGGVAKTLKTNNAAVPNGVANGWQKASTLPLPLKEKEKEKERERDRVWVARDTPEWTAWQQVKKRGSIWSTERSQNGWWFESQWPPDHTLDPAIDEPSPNPEEP